MSKKIEFKVGNRVIRTGASKNFTAFGEGRFIIKGNIYIIASDIKNNTGHFLYFKDNNMDSSFGWSADKFKIVGNRVKYNTKVKCICLK